MQNALFDCLKLNATNLLSLNSFKTNGLIIMKNVSFISNLGSDIKILLIYFYVYFIKFSRNIVGDKWEIYSNISEKFGFFQ